MTRIVSLIFAVVQMAIFSNRVSALPIFNGDPVDPSTSTAYMILPGVARVYPGSDKKFNTSDDIIDVSMPGDVDIVLRTGGTYSGGAIPAPAAGIANAPAIVPGGSQFGSGSEVAFQVIVSDGATSPPAGNALLDAQHDNRAAIVLAFADLDGDGFIGPTAVDGNGDNAIERQETMTIVGRQLGVISNGVAEGGVAVDMGAPASVGGLGIVVVAGALMGNSAPKYFDGPWVATLMPRIPPIDVNQIFSGGARAPTAGVEEPIEMKLEFDKWFLSAPNHPSLGTPFAIPTDGSSVTVDLLRSESGSAATAALAVPISAAGYSPSVGRRLLPAVAASGQRQLAERVDTISLSDDGTASSSLMLFPIDVLGNPADPSTEISVTLEAEPGVAITLPDEDGDPQRETILLTTARAVDVTIVDSSGARPPSVSLLLTANDIPVSSIQILGGTGAINTATPTTGAAATPTTAPTSLATPTPIPDCPALPASCEASARSNLWVKDDSNPSMRRLSWKWSKGFAAVTTTDLGDPLNGDTSYSLCVYDQSGGGATLALAITMPAHAPCDRGPCWKAITRGGWMYNDPAGRNYGVTKAILKSGAAGKPHLLITGKGANLSVPTSAGSNLMFAQDPSVLVQLHRNDSANCWSSAFVPAGTKLNTATQFKAAAR